MTGSWDKTIKFWDLRQATPIISFNTQEKVYCADVIYPMAVVSTAQRGILVYQLANQPSEFKVCIVFYIKILHLHSSIGMKKYVGSF